MIACVKSSAALSALLILLPCSVPAADDLPGAVRELTRRTIAFAGRGEPVSLAWQNRSPLSPAEFSQVQAAMEAAFNESGTRVSNVAPLVEAKVTVSASATQFLLVEEARKGDERQTWIASWKRPTASPGSTDSAISLEKRLLLEQEEQILDVASLDQGLLVLTPSRISFRKPGDNQSQPISSSRPWPRDLRGRLRVNGGGFKAFLPGVLCTGALDPALTSACRTTDEPWTLDAGARGVLLANFSPGRNHFDGRVTASAGAHKTLPPFFSAASVEEGGKAYFLFALLDGRTLIFDAALDSVGTISGWGSDLAGAEAHCGGGSQTLATKSGGQNEPDAVRAFALSGRAAMPLSPPLDLPGPVTALWPMGGNAVMAVVHHLSTGMYQAYTITVNCGG